MAKIKRKVKTKTLVPKKTMNSPKTGFKPNREMGCGGKKK